MKRLSANVPRLIVGCVLALCFARAAVAKDWRELTIASEGARPPYNYLDQNGELMGFEIDLGRELCARMKVTCKFVQQDWDSLVPALVEKRVDAIMAALEIGEGLLQKIDFSKPYVRMPNALVTSKSAEWPDAAPKTFSGKTIGVEADGPHQTFLESVYADSVVKPYASIEEAILDLAEGRVDAVFGDKDALHEFLTKRRDARCCHILADVPRDPTYFSEGIGVGLRQEDQDLKAMFNKALDAAIADGGFEKIRAKYFEFGVR